jgi:hypothetical protein
VSCVQCQRVHEEVCASLVCSTLQWLDRVLASTRSHGGTCVDDRRTLAHQNLVHAWDRTTCSACAPPWWVAAPLRQRWLRRVTRMRLRRARGANVRRSRCRCAQLARTACDRGIPDAHVVHGRHDVVALVDDRQVPNGLAGRSAVAASRARWVLRERSRDATHDVPTCTRRSSAGSQRALHGTLHVRNGIRRHVCRSRPSPATGEPSPGADVAGIEPP